MANNNTTQPVAKPPAQTGGMRASAGLAGAKGNVKSYLEARGAKPVASTGTYSGGAKPPVSAGPKNPGAKPPQGAGDSAGSYGNLGKGRRMQGKPISAANRAGRAGGGNINPPGGGARFSDSNAVPTGGRNQNGQLGQLAQRFGAGGGANRGAMGRAQEFLRNRQRGGQTPPTKPPGRGGGQLQGLATQLGGTKPAPSKPALSAARGALSQLQKPGHSQHQTPAQGGGMPDMKPPQGGKPGTAVTMPPSSRPPLLSGGPKPVGGGGGTTGPMRQRPKVV